MKKATVEDNSIDANGKMLLDKLPEDIRPKVTVEKFPRIVNKLGTLWKRPDEFVTYLDELLVDKRGKRKGFPLSVALELASVKDHYEMKVHPERSKAYLWDPRLKGS
jgi:hypothetical protein